MVEKVLADRGLHLPLHDVRIESPEEARRLRFLGSPTVRVRGRDIEVLRHNDLRFGYQCRLYCHEDGTLSNVPPAALVLQAIERYG